jgi:hypothetical protein
VGALTWRPTGSLSESGEQQVGACWVYKAVLWQRLGFSFRLLYKKLAADSILAKFSEAHLSRRKILELVARSKMKGTRHATHIHSNCGRIVSWMVKSISLLSRSFNVSGVLSTDFCVSQRAGIGCLISGHALHKTLVTRVPCKISKSEFGKLLLPSSFFKSEAT